MPTKKKIYLLGCIVLLSGCHQHYGVLVKRESEQNCPTDIRQTVPWCAGEDAIFRCPCGPNEQFHGHKPTCWRPWQSSGAQWRDLHCEPLGATCETGLPESFSGEQVPQPIEVLVPTQSGLAMPLPASSEREPSDLPPTGEDESLPGPQPLGLPSDGDSSQGRPQLPWKPEAAVASPKSLTNYFHNLDKQRGDSSGYRSTSRPLEPKLSQAAVAPIAPEKPVLLPPVEWKKASVSQQAVVPDRKSSVPVGIPSKPLCASPRVKKEPLSRQSISSSQKKTQADSDTVLKFALVKPPASSPDPLARHRVVKPTVHLEKPPARSSLTTSTQAVPSREPTREVPASRNEISFVSPVANQPATQGPIRLMTQETPEKRLHLKSMCSSKMTFVR